GTSVFCMPVHDKEQLYRHLQDVMSREDFEERIRAEVEAYGGLIDPATAALVVVDKTKPHFFSSTTVGDLKPDTDATLYVAVDYVGDTRVFDRGRVVNIVVGDATGRCVLVLWDANVGLAENSRMVPGQVLKVINGYVKNGYYGLEVNVGRWGVVDPAPPHPPRIEPSTSTVPLLRAARGIVDVEATVREIAPTRVYLTDKGESFAAVVRAADSSGQRSITLWNHLARDIQGYAPGDRLRFRRLYVKDGELHAGDISSLSPAPSC
ncbi:MAG: OB-fold nucleic acid binding domain-containing protein, partial [Candidatus Thermoplasmatota archaeon]|nr:OB-fold nucleic acid binding domain-containing protein [Candidatus Thermoplasmatota archaeon]